jgi:sodium transport system permease protein
VNPRAPDHRSLGWRLAIVARKELRDHFRDKRSLLLALLYPLLGPLLVAGSLYVAGDVLNRQQGSTERMSLPARGMEYALDFVRFLDANGVGLYPAPSPPGDMVRNGEVAVGLDIPPEAATGKFTIRVYVDFSKIGNLRASATVGDLIAEYNRQRAAKLMQELGLPDDALVSVAVTQVNVTRPADMAVFLYNLMPPLIMFMIFLAGVHITVDMTAGERERGSLEPLLIAPVERAGLLFAKAGVGFLMTALAMVINLAGFRILLGIVADMHPAITPPPDVAVFLVIFLIAVPLMVLAVSFQIAIALISRSMKEAQIYLGLLPLVPALPGMVMVFAPLHPTLAISAVPLMGQLAQFNQLVGGRGVTVAEIALSATVTLVLSALISWQAARLFQRERLLFAT